MAVAGSTAGGCHSYATRRPMPICEGNGRSNFGGAGRLSGTMQGVYVGALLWEMEADAGFDDELGCTWWRWTSACSISSGGGRWRSMRHLAQH